MKIKEIQPFVTTTTKNVIYKISYITNRSIRQVCNDFCYLALADKKKLMEELTPYLKWTMKIENNVYTPKVEPRKTESGEM